MCSWYMLYWTKFIVVAWSTSDVIISVHLYSVHSSFTFMISLQVWHKRCQGIWIHLQPLLWIQCHCSLCCRNSCTYTIHFCYSLFSSPNCNSKISNIIHLNILGDCMPIVIWMTNAERTEIFRVRWGMLYWDTCMSSKSSDFGHDPSEALLQQGGVGQAPRTRAKVNIP